MLPFAEVNVRARGRPLIIMLRVSFSGVRVYTALSCHLSSGLGSRCRIGAKCGEWQWEGHSCVLGFPKTVSSFIEVNVRGGPLIVMLRVTFPGSGVYGVSASVISLLGSQCHIWAKGGKGEGVRVTCAY